MADRNIYIDADAAIGGDGSISAPYDSFSDINWATGGANSIFDWIAAGDDVYINITGTWEDKLVIGIDGTPSARITVQGYADAKMYGSKVVTGWTLTLGQTYTYEITEDNAGYDECVGGHFAIFEDEAFLQWQDSIANVEANSGSCFYDTTANKMYIHPFDSDNPTTNGHTYRATERDSCILSSDFDYLQFKSISFYYTSSYAIKPFRITTGTVYWPDNVIYDDLYIFAPRHDGMGLGGTNILAQNIEVHHAYGNGAFVFANRNPVQGSPDGSNIVLKDSSIKTSIHFDKYGGTCYVCAFKFEGDAQGINIDNVDVDAKVYYGMLFGPEDDPLYPQGNISLSNITTNDIAGYAISCLTDAGNVAVDRLIMNEKPTFNKPIRLGESTSFILKNSLLRGPTNADSWCIDTEDSVDPSIQYNIFIDYLVGIYTDSGATDVLIYNNTFFGGNYGVVSDSNGNGVCLKNNIFSGVVQPWNFNSLNDLTETDYNLFYDYTSLSGLTLAQIQGYGLELHSIDNEDPLFIDATNEDFRLQSTSPCIDAGAIIAGVTDIGQLDPWDNATNRTPNIGADQASDENFYRKDAGFDYNESSYICRVKQILPTP